MKAPASRPGTLINVGALSSSAKAPLAERPDAVTSGRKRHASKASDAATPQRFTSCPILLPESATPSAMVTATGCAPGAEALVLSRVVAKLRRFGGESPLGVLTRQLPDKLQKLLAGYPQVFDIFIPGHAHFEDAREPGELAPSIHVRLRGEEEVQVLSSSRRLAAVERGLVPRPAPARALVRGFGKASAARKAATAEAAGAAVVISDSGEEHLGESEHEAAEEATGPGKIPSVSEAFTLATQSWMCGSAFSGGINDAVASRRCFYLVLAGGLGALRPGHGDLLFAFDLASKVLYEYVAQGGCCVVLWTPDDPAVNAAIWTVLPLPPERVVAPRNTEEEGCAAPGDDGRCSDDDLGFQIDDLIDDAALAARASMQADPPARAHHPEVLR